MDSVRILSTLEMSATSPILKLYETRKDYESLGREEVRELSHMRGFKSNSGKVSLINRLTYNDGFAGTIDASAWQAIFSFIRPDECANLRFICTAWASIIGPARIGTKPLSEFRTKADEVKHAIGCNATFWIEWNSSWIYEHMDLTARYAGIYVNDNIIRGLYLPEHKQAMNLFIGFGIGGHFDYIRSYMKIPVVAGAIEQTSEYNKYFMTDAAIAAVETDHIEWFEELDKLGFGYNIEDVLIYALAAEKFEYAQYAYEHGARDLYTWFNKYIVQYSENLAAIKWVINKKLLSANYCFTIAVAYSALPLANYLLELGANDVLGALMTSCRTLHIAGVHYALELFAKYVPESMREHVVNQAFITVCSVEQWHDITTINMVANVLCKFGANAYIQACMGACSKCRCIKIHAFRNVLQKCPQCTHRLSIHL